MFETSLLLRGLILLYICILLLHVNMAHPYGVQPWHAAMLTGEPPDALRNRGLGLLARLPDEAILSMLYYLSAKDLSVLGKASKALYVWSNHADLWKALVLEVRKAHALCGNEAAAAAS